MGRFVCNRGRITYKPKKPYLSSHRHAHSLAPGRDTFWVKSSSAKAKPKSSTKDLPQQVQNLVSGDAGSQPIAELPEVQRGRGETV